MYLSILLDCTMLIPNAYAYLNNNYNSNNNKVQKKKTLLSSVYDFFCKGYLSQYLLSPSSICQFLFDFVRLRTRDCFC